jgi:chitin synthase
MFCTYPKAIDEKQQLLRIAESLEVMEKRLEGLERLVYTIQSG